MNPDHQPCSFYPHPVTDSFISGYPAMRLEPDLVRRRRNALWLYWRTSSPRNGRKRGGSVIPIPAANARHHSRKPRRYCTFSSNSSLATQVLSPQPISPPSVRVQSRVQWHQHAAGLPPILYIENAHCRASLLRPLLPLAFSRTIARTPSSINSADRPAPYPMTVVGRIPHPIYLCRCGGGARQLPHGRATPQRVLLRPSCRPAD